MYRFDHMSWAEIEEELEESRETRKLIARDPSLSVATKKREIADIGEWAMQAVYYLNIGVAGVPGHAGAGTRSA
jgi:hypothetical protein